MRLAIWTCASLSVAAHALAVTLLPPVEHPVPVNTRASGSATWQVRSAHIPQAIHSMPPPASDEIHSRTSSHPVSNEPQPESPGSDENNGALNANLEVQPVIDAEPTPVVLSTGSNGSLDGLTEYIPRPRLTVPPVAQSPVIMTAPPGDYPDGRITGILSLYIDETGRVDHILFSGPDMPREFEEVARQTFISMTFRPGELNGMPVKSRIRIEVVFDNTPLNEDATPPKP